MKSFVLDAGQETLSLCTVVRCRSIYFDHDDADLGFCLRDAVNALHIASDRRVRGWVPGATKRLLERFDVSVERVKSYGPRWLTDVVGSNDESVLVAHTTPEQAHNFLQRHLGKPWKAIVE